MKLAIIGASIGQRVLCKKAEEMGLETYCFSWEKGAICKDFVSHFVPISIANHAEICDYCKKEKIDGIVSNASERTAEVVSIIAEKLGLPALPYSVFRTIQSKEKVRSLTNSISGLCPVKYLCSSAPEEIDFFPCVVKPCTGAGKRGVSFVKNKNDLQIAFEYAKKDPLTNILVEKYVRGKEISIETLSFNGKHVIAQITDKENSGPPHFVEIGHHQPSSLDDEIKVKIHALVIKILDELKYNNSAAHIEMRVGENGELYLIEINPRGGGDEISNSLVELSTDFDYVKAMIQVALGIFVPPKRINYSCSHSGICYLCQQTKELLPFFLQDEIPSWCIQRKIVSLNIRDATGNTDRNGFFIYKANKKIEMTDILRGESCNH